MACRAPWSSRTSRSAACFGPLPPAWYDEWVRAARSAIAALAASSFLRRSFSFLESLPPPLAPADASRSLATRSCNEAASESATSTKRRKCKTTPSTATTLSPMRSCFATGPLGSTSTTVLDWSMPKPSRPVDSSRLAVTSTSSILLGATPASASIHRARSRRGEAGWFETRA